MNAAVIFGAGNVGRGFIGQLFCESGYRVTFVDIDEPLISVLRQRECYAIRLVNNEQTEIVQVGPVTGLLSADAVAVADALARASLGATAVGPRALPHIAPLVARGIERRVSLGLDVPLNLIICENLKGASGIFRDMVAQHLSGAARDYLASHVGLVDTVIGRMVPELPPELCAQDPSLIIVEPYKELPVDRAGFVGQVPSIVGMQAVGGGKGDSFALYTARKLYLHNAGHALLGYLGYWRGHVLGYEALADPEIRAILEAALDESVRGIAAVYGADESWLRAHVADLLARFANRVLADPVLRLGRDPLRKLAPSDRLVGAARTAERAGITPINLAWGIAGALAFDAPDDPMALELQGRIARVGVAQTLAELCQIDPAEPLGRAVLTRYRALLVQAPVEPYADALRRVQAG